MLLSLLATSGCAMLGDSPAKTKKDVVNIPLEDRPLQEPLPTNDFELTSGAQSVIGEPQLVFTRPQDTLSDLAREYGLGYDEIVAANPDVNPWLPGENTAVILPTQYILPDTQMQGLVLNIATKRVFYFPTVAEGETQKVLTYPIGIGRVGWETPLGSATVVSKARDPSWWVPLSVRQEHAEMGNPLPSVVPPGPDNPLGTRVLKLDMPGYLIHGTNAPYGVGMRVSHGCVRLYPENIELLYDMVAIGEPVMIINEPYQMGTQDGVLYFEAHAPLEDDAITAEEHLQRLTDTRLDVSGQPLNQHLKDHIGSLAAAQNGIPVSIVMYDSEEVMARVRVVHNTVEPDPNAPTLTEVREMMDAVEEEPEEESL